MSAIWAFPLTLAGRALARLTGCSLYATLADGVQLYLPGPWFLRVFFDRYSVAAFTWGETIIGATEKDLKYALPHELIHVKQAYRWGILLPILYGLSSLWALVTGKNPYVENYFERQARQESGR